MSSLINLAQKVNKLTHIKIIKKMKTGAPIIGKTFEPTEKGYKVAQLHAYIHKINRVAGVGFEPTTFRL